MDRVVMFLGTQSYLRLGVGALVLTYVLPTLLLWSLDGLGVIAGQRLRHVEAIEFEQLQLALRFAIACVVGPFVETLCFQWGPLSLMPLQSAVQRLIALLCTAVAFGLMHTQSVGALISATLTGIVFSVLCLTLIQTQRAAFGTVFVVHALRNGIALAIHALGIA